MNPEGYREMSRAKRKATPVARLIIKDCLASDRKNGRAADVDVAFVESLIADGCSYCGETNVRMTIDRIDNTLGHTRANVVAACARCNYARRDMPHEAWVVVAVGMRKARELGLFGTWVGGRFGHVKPSPA